MTIRSKMSVPRPRSAGFIFLLLGLLLITAAAPPARALEPDEIWQKCNASVFYVEGELPSGNRDHGTGFACEVNGTNHLITALQILAGARSLRIGPTNRNLKEASAYLGRKEKDIAALRVHADLTFPPLKMRTTPLRTGERVYVIGFTLGRIKSITQGILAAQSDTTLQFDAPISLGSAGAPVLDKDGLVIGVVSSSFDAEELRTAQNVNEAVNLASARQFLAESITPLAGAVVKMGAVTMTQKIITTAPTDSPAPHKKPAKTSSNTTGKTFLEAWKELAAHEVSLVESVRKLKVLELHEYLTGEWKIATSNDGETDEEEEPLPTKAEQQVLLHDILSAHRDINQAVTNVHAFLIARSKEFERLPPLFENVREDDILREYLKSEASDDVFKRDLKPEELAPLLRRSVAFLQATYEDTAFQISFLGRNLERLKSRDAKLLRQYHRIREKFPEIGFFRDEPGMDYPFDEIAKDSSGRTELTYFLQSFSIIDLRDHPDVLTIGSRIQDNVEQMGGFEDDLLHALETAAFDLVQKGEISAALDLSKINVAHKACPDLSLHAMLFAYEGKTELASILYRKAFNDSRQDISAFDLARFEGERTRTLIIDDLFDGPSPGSKLEPRHRSNFEKLCKEFRSLPWTKLAESTDPALTLASPEFSALGEFERMAIVHRLKYKLEKEPKSVQKKLQDIIDRIPAAREADERLRID